MTLTATETADRQLVEHLSSELQQASHELEVARESLADIELAREDQGWKRLGFWGDMHFTREGLANSARLCRVMAIANPLLKRGLSLRHLYVWGSGVQIAAKANGASEDNPQEQDVDGYLQRWLGDAEVKRVLMGAVARERNERTLGTDGNLHVALVTNRATGWVRPRLVPFDEVSRVISNPQDKLERWFFLREWTELVEEAGYSGVTRVRRQTRRVLYPSIDYRPAAQPATYAGIPVEWDAPVAEINVNALEGWDFGVGDSFNVLPWARAYTDLLTDWARLIKALSRFAFKATSPRSATAKRAAEAQQAAQGAPADPLLPGPRGSQAGATVHLGPGQDLVPIPQTGATIDAGSGRPIASLVASGLDLPVTMLLGDPGITGARATAETLDFPTELMASARRQVWTEFFERVCGYVIEMAAKAPAGPLRRGLVSRDRSTGREVVQLAGDTDPGIEVIWPDLSETPLADMIKAITEADATRRMPPLETLKLLLRALKVDDADQVVADWTDEDGRFIDPNQMTGQQIADAMRRGQNPARFDEPPPPAGDAVDDAA